MTRRYPARVAITLVLCSCFCGSLAQMMWPLHGQGDPPEGVQTIVEAEIMFDSLEAIESNSNTYAATVWFHFAWQDARAIQAIQNSTAIWAQGWPCNRTCDISGHWSGGCCDNVFIPHIDLPNLKYIDQNSVAKYRIWVDPDPSGAPSNTVHWATRTTASFHSPFDFRAWPFEHQHLLLEMTLPPVIASHVSLQLKDVVFLNNTPHTKGEVIPGWYVVKITKRAFDISACYNNTGQTTSMYHINFDNNSNPVVTYEVVRPADYAQLSTPLPGVITTSVQLAACSRFATPIDNDDPFPEALAQYVPKTVLVDIMVKRFRGYHVLSTLLPQMILAYLTFVTYAMERSDFESRATVIVTLVLAASALQFTWDFPPAKYLNAVQQIMVATYVLYFVVAIESMCTSWICRHHEHRRRDAQVDAALYGSSKLGSSPTMASASSAEVPVATIGGVTHRSNGGPFARYAGGPVAEGTLHGDEDEFHSPVLNNEERRSDDEHNMGVGAASTKIANGVTVGNMGGPSLFDNQEQWNPVADVRGKGKRTLFERYGRNITLGKAAHKTKDFQRRLNKDEAFAQLFARRLDNIFCWTLLVGYTITVSILLWLTTEVGDHKLMLQGDRPANM